MGTTEKIMTVFFVVFGIVPLANALTVRLSLDGINPAPETVDVVIGQVITMYVVSDSDGISYWKWIHTNGPAAISNVQSYPAAGDLASISDLSDTYPYPIFKLEAKDSADNIQAGKHFSFDFAIGSDGTQGMSRHVWLDSGPAPDDTVTLNVVPRPPIAYYVDAAEGSDNNDGLSPETAFATIQKGIDSTDDGDTVIVQPGLYDENINFIGKNITLRSIHPNDPNIVAATIIDGNQNGSVVTFNSGEDANCVLDGFTITNGYDGGVDCRNSSPTIQRNLIKENTGLGNRKGAIYCNNAFPRITNNVIAFNTGFGVDGIHCDTASPIIEGNIITGNTDDGIENDNYSFPLITNNLIVRNGHDGIECDMGSDAHITNNTVIGPASGNACSGIFSYDSSPIIINNIIMGFTGSVMGHDAQGIKGACFASYNNLWGNTNNDVVGTGNMSVDPLFLDPENGNYHLLKTSPCIDAASDANVYTDIEGNIRPFDFPGVDNNGELPEFDMGAYELVPIEAEMKLAPQMLNCSSKGKWVKAHFVLPEEFLPEDVDVYAPAVAEPIGAESEYIELLGAGKGPVRLEVVFDRQAFCDGLADTDDGSLEITVIGSFTTSRYFRGTDTITIKPRR